MPYIYIIIDVIRFIRNYAVHAAVHCSSALGLFTEFLFYFYKHFTILDHTKVFLYCVIYIITKNQKVWLCGRGDLTSLFFSKVAK